jgi:hypothetical protein
MKKAGVSAGLLADFSTYGAKHLAPLICLLGKA